jgi:hypothetical protein
MFASKSLSPEDFSFVLNKIASFYSNEEDTIDAVGETKAHLMTSYNNTPLRNKLKVRSGKWTVTTNEGVVFDLTISYKIPNAVEQTEAQFVPGEEEQFCLIGRLLKQRTEDDEFQPKESFIVGNVFGNFASISVVNNSKNVLQFQFMVELLPPTYEQDEKLIVVEKARGFIIDKTGVTGSVIMNYNLI